MKREDILIRLFNSGYISEDEFKLLSQNIGSHTTIKGDDVYFIFDRSRLKRD